ncbi:MAG: ComF family protein [Gammaproteobacteria bacterium]
MLKRLINALARCVVCDDPAPCNTLCAHCAASFKRIRWPCSRCGLPRRQRHAPCGSCLIHTPEWDAAASAFAYHFPVDYLLKRAKFRGRAADLEALATKSAEHFATAPSRHADMILPVPLHWRRRWQRGFNQAEELARPIAEQLGLALVTTALKRVRATKAQSHLHTDDRAVNLHRAFACRTSLAGASIIIFDDVMTTGATLGAATRAANAAGAQHVCVWTCARAVMK